MDIGNLPVYTNKTRSSGPLKKKDAWDRIGDYEEPPAPIKPEEENEDNEKEQVVQRHQTPPSLKEKLASDDAASVASELAVKESHKHQSCP